MIIQNNTVVASPSSSSSSPSSSSPSSSSSAESDWLGVKMETDDSPEPDLSPTQTSPELPPNGSPGNNDNSNILTPPSAFAEGTPKQQIHGTPIILQRGGGTFTIPSRLALAPLPRPDRGSASRQPVASTVCNDSVSRGQSPALDTTSPVSVSGHTHVVTRSGGHAPGVTESVADSATSVTNMTSLLQRGTPSIMATSSMMNSTYALHSPSSAGRSANSSHRTPSIMATDSLMGNSTFAVRSPFSLQPASSNTTRSTPSLLITDSVMGNSTFGVQSLSATVHQRSNSSHDTPCLLATNSVMGNSSMRTPTSPLLPTSSTPQSATARLDDTNSSSRTSTWFATPNDLSGQPSASRQPAQTPQANAFSLSTISEKEVERSEQMMDVTSAANCTADDLAECWARMESVKNHDHELKEELQEIKRKFFSLLDNLGLSHDIYYNAVTPAETPNSIHLDPQFISKRVLTSAEALDLCQSQASNQASLINNNFPTNPDRMSSPHHTPRRRNNGHQRRVDMSSNYADLVIDQLLARARSEASSSKSSSPPDLQSVSDQAAAAACAASDHLSHQQEDGHSDAYDLADNVNVNQSPEDPYRKDSAKSKILPVFTGFETGDDFESAVVSLPDYAVEQVMMHEPNVSPEILCPSSGSVSASNNGSPSNSSVPNLSKELLSRVQYYSDFTLDRQKKIDEAVDILKAVGDVSNEASPPAPSQAPDDHLDTNISPRCIEGTESIGFKPPLVLGKPPMPSIPVILQKSYTKGKRYKVIGGLSSKDANDNDSSSATGSVPSSQQSSHPTSRHSSQHSSRHSSRDRHSARSSGDHRSSSRGSRCSTHPLASSTFIVDPSSSSNSPGSGSAYTWSLDSSADENLHQSFLRSEKRHRRSRPSHRQSRSSPSHGLTTSHGISHPATTDSPPYEQASDVDANLHLTHMVSVIDSNSRRFGGRTYENSMQSLPTPRSRSMPRTSTRIGCLIPKGKLDMDHKASSSPELSNPTCSNLNYAVNRIGPSNLSSDILQTETEKSSYRFIDRPELLGKSSSSGSGTSYHSDCLACNPRLVVYPADTSIKLTERDDPCDEILTNSPPSYDGSGMQPPCNSCTSPAGSNKDYATFSDSPSERSTIIASAPRQPRAFAAKSPGVFKVPFSPAARTVKRIAGGAGGRSTQNVGVKTVGTPRLPIGLLKYKEKRKLFNFGQQGQSSGLKHTPKILDRKALARKFKKFSNNFKKEKDEAKIHTLANL